jgi:hypothetical protein
MNNIFYTDGDMYFKIIELAKQRGKKEGESMQEEFDEMRTKYPDRFQHLGATDMDKDMILGNLREETKLKILDLTQEKKNDKTE